MYQNNLKKFRLEKGLSQQSVANSVGIVIRLYQYYEAGGKEPAVRTAIKLAKVLEHSVEEIFPLDENH